MKAAQISSYGDESAVTINEIERPKPSKSQVLVEVQAASLNPFDTAIRSGAYQESIPLQFPATLGGDIAGVIKETGEEIPGFSVGDKVYGQANVVAGNSGAFAEFATTSSDQVSKIPADLSFEQAASLPLVGVSALQALTEHISLQPGQKILIHGGSGGIGSVAIQIAKHLGAFVATTSTGEGLEYVKKLGADEIIDYKNQSFDEILQDYDAVFDTVAGETYKKSFKVLRRGGVIVSMLSPPDENLIEQYGVTAIAQQTKVTTEALKRLSQLVDKGVVSPHVDKIFPLDEAQEAFRVRENGKILGKVVLKVKD